MYGSPVPAWKKKLLEQQRLQQQEQEKAAQAIPKWKLKQLEQKQQQQQQHQEVNTDDAPHHSVMAADAVAAVTMESLVTSPSDERLDHGPVMDHVIVTARSNVVVRDNPVEPVVNTNDNTKKKWSPPPNPTKESSGRPRLRLGASPESDAFGIRGSDAMATSKSWC